MIPVDPVNLMDTAPYGPLAYYGHIAIGSVGLIAAITALIVRKGSPPHIWAGRIFIGSIVILAVTSLVMLSMQMVPPLLVAAITSVYAVATAFLALKPASKGVKRAEYGLFGIELLLLMLFITMASITVATSNLNPVGPAVISIIPLILLAGDINFFRKADQRTKLRVRRHLSRMIWAFVIAVRAPMAEIYHYLSLPVWVILFGPLVVAPILIWLFLRKQPAI